MLNLSNKKGGFIGWFLVIGVILFIVLPLLMGGITKQMNSGDAFLRASLNCHSLIPTATLSQILCRPILVQFSGTQTIPLLFVLATFVLISILMYALIEEVPPFQNQIASGKKAPAATFAITISAFIAFFTPTAKYITILLTISGSVVVYTVIAVFLTFIFARIALHTHKEGLKYHKEFYKDLGKDKKEIRNLERENKEVSQDIKLSKRIEKELKQFKENDLEELKPLEKLETTLKSFESPLNKLNAINDPKEQEYALNLFKQHMPQILKLTKRIEKEFADEKKIDEIKDKFEKEIKKKLNRELKFLINTENGVFSVIKNSNLEQNKKKHFENQLKTTKSANIQLIEEIKEHQQEINHLEQELDDMRNQKLNDIRAILSRINRIAQIISYGNLPTSKDILDITKEIENLKALIEHNEVIINSISDLETATDHYIKKIRGQIDNLIDLNKKVAGTMNE